MKNAWMVFILILPLTGISQKVYNVDSLEALLAGAGDSLRASLLYKVAKQEYNKNPDKCLEYAEEAASLAGERGDSALQAMSYQIAGVIHKNKGNFELAMEKQVKAARILENIGNKMMLASSYNDLGVLNKNLGHYEKAIGYYKKSLAIIMEAGNERVSALLLNNIGTIYDAKEDLDSAEF
ncbi:MAG: tetratricopeptide repeat protein [Bacteroidales bacterium]|nr:tetratricopeptide repeat protein [Bacteroidales bacterium]